MIVRRSIGMAIGMLGCVGSWGAAAQSVDARRPVGAPKQTERMLPPVVVTASVDPEGRIVPGTAPGGPIQRIGASAVKPDAASPCADMAALSADEGRRLVEATAREEQFQPEFVVAVAKTESNFLSTSLSPKGAYGLMQLMPATAQAFGVNICDPKDNVRGGILFLRELTAKYRNPVYVLAAYNAGEPAILKAKGVPPIAETVGYVAAVLNDFYQWPASGARMDAFAGGSDRKFAAEQDPTRPIQRAGVKPKTASRGEAQGWQGGFVQNFD